MKHRLSAVLVIACFAIEGAGCAWMKEKPSGEQISMPMQTGSNVQRRVMIPNDPGAVTKKPEKKKKSKDKEKDAKKKESKKKDTRKVETKRPTSKPSPTPARPKRESKPTPEPETPTMPDRLR